MQSALCIHELYIHVLNQPQVKNRLKIFQSVPEGKFEFAIQW